MINCFDVESLSVLQKYHFKQTFLIGENVEDDVLNVMEPEIPIQESIFGVDCSDEETTESYSDVEKELLELESIFE